ncbi:hypothetical protein [Shimia sp. Alg240-R146]|uniref:hypothetical protein n=1 Tax=Shimia sp. Alg240-R146 TaxID=2993449 RepID=UPI0022E2DEDA|nr:hypothetical protein [Shimia sp. Alg240-R146]
MKYVPASALVQTSRFARLFELIRQENLVAQAAQHPAPASQPDFVSEFLVKAASASLRRAA